MASRVGKRGAELTVKRARAGQDFSDGDGHMNRLALAVGEVRAGVRLSPRTSKLFAAGAPKIAQKVIEEAAEVGIEAVLGDRLAVINESVDLLYNLSVLWAELEIAPDDVWREMERREAVLGMAEKLPKTANDSPAWRPTALVDPDAADNIPTSAPGPLPPM